MRRVCFVALLLVIGCSKGDEGVTDTRDPIATQYVAGGEMPVHAKPDDKSPVVTKYQHGESVPIIGTPYPATCSVAVPETVRHKSHSGTIESNSLSPYRNNCPRASYSPPIVAVGSGGRASSICRLNSSAILPTTGVVAGVVGTTNDTLGKASRISFATCSRRK